MLRCSLHLTRCTGRSSADGPADGGRAGPGEGASSGPACHHVSILRNGAALITPPPPSRQTTGNDISDATAALRSELMLVRPAAPCDTLAATAACVAHSHTLPAYSFPAQPNPLRTGPQLMQVSQSPVAIVCCHPIGKPSHPPSASRSSQSQEQTAIVKDLISVRAPCFTCPLHSAGPLPAQLLHSCRFLLTQELVIFHSETSRTCRTKWRWVHHRGTRACVVALLFLVSPNLPKPDRCLPGQRGHARAGGGSPRGAHQWQGACSGFQSHVVSTSPLPPLPPTSPTYPPTRPTPATCWTKMT